MADKKSFYNEHDNWTPIASECDREVTAALKPIFEKWTALGYSPREIAHLISGAAFTTEVFTVHRARVERRKALAKELDLSDKEPENNG